MSWRPASGWDIERTDDELARIGLIVALEAQAHHVAWMMTKPMLRLTVDSWKTWEQRQMKQIVGSLIDAADDDHLRRLLRNFEEQRAVAQTLRHQVAHALWGRGEEAGTVVARDVRRSETITREHIDRALTAVAALTITGKECLMRLADLIAEHQMTGGESHGGGPAVFRQGGWVWL